MTYRRAGGVVVVAALALGCSKREEVPTRPRGLTPAEAPAPAASTIAEEDDTPASASAPPARSLPNPFAGASDPGALIEPKAESSADAGGEAGASESKRDLPAELAQLVGQPLSCVDFAAIVEGGGKLDISVSAQVVPSGRITRAEVSAPGQPPKALRCIEQLVTAGSLQAPVPEAPRAVRTTVTMQVVANPR